MPRTTQLSACSSALRGSLYSSLRHRAAAAPELFPLHIGDTWMEPAVGCRMQDLRVQDHPGMHRYDPPKGRAELVEAIARRVSRRQAVPTGPGHVLVGAGATGVLAGVVGALVDPGDEVLVLAPHWPLVVGQIRLFGGVPVSVPFYTEEAGLAQMLQRVEDQVGPRTVAISLNTPNNPTGRVLDRTWLQGLVDLARRHDLWLLSDEVYEDYAWGGEHVYTRSLAPERTLSIHSFSKAWGMAGNRCGYVAGPPQVILAAWRITTHTFYSAPTSAQLAALRALQGPGDAWAAEASRLYQQVGAQVAEILGVPEAQGGTFLFLDVSVVLAGRPLEALLELCADHGLLVAPGPTFGPYPQHLRLCFTAAPPELTLRGARLLAELLERSARGG